MKKIFTITVLSISILTLASLATSNFLAEAGSSHNVSGWAWSDSAGWISFNSANDPATTADYGVNVDDTGIFSGYAWSDVVGWISFNASDVSGCPSGTCQPQVNLTTGEVTGFAKMLLDYTGSGDDAFANGWNGWIELSGSNHTSPDMSGNSGLTYDPTNEQFLGYAWSDDIGWIDFYPGAGFGGTFRNTNPLNVSCGSSPATAYANDTVTWTASPTGGDGTYTYTWSGDVSGTGQVETIAYASEGIKNASVEVSSGPQVVNASCSPVSVVGAPDGISCRVSPASTFTDENVTWEVFVVGLSDYQISWSGDATGSSDTVVSSYGTPGVKTATANIISTIDSSLLGSCSNSVRVGLRPIFQEF